MLSADEEAQLRERLDQLTQEHRDLDDVITTLSEGVYPDQLQIRRLKKRKRLTVFKRGSVTKGNNPQRRKTKKRVIREKVAA